MSYTSFDCFDLKTDKRKITANDSLTVSFMLKNVGIREGTEIVQLYLHDKVASVTRPVMELKDFKRVTLAPQETETVTFTITPDKLMMYDIDMQRVIESGDFELMIGASSEDIRLKDMFTVKNK